MTAAVRWGVCGFVASVPLGNAENYRMRLYNFPILLSFLFTEKYLLFLQKSCAFSRSKNRSSTLFFRGIALFFYVSTIGQAHRAAHVPDPTSTDAVKMALKE